MDFAAPEPPQEEQPKGVGRGMRIAVAGAVVVVAVALLAFGPLFSAQPPGSRTTSTFYPGGADSFLTSAVNRAPSGFALQSSKAPSGADLQAADWAVLKESDGSTANMTVFVYSSTNASLTRYSALVASLKGLPGYTDTSSSISAYAGYGGCYAVGEDVDGIAVATGLCADGNLLFQVHVVSTQPFSVAQDHFSGLIAALYQSAY